MPSDPTLTDAAQIREARVRAAMRSGMTELAAQRLADRLENPDDLQVAIVAIGIIGDLIDWFGAPDWTGPQIPTDLARRIADLMERRS